MSIPNVVHIEIIWYIYIHTYIYLLHILDKQLYTLHQYWFLNGNQFRCIVYIYPYTYTYTCIYNNNNNCNTYVCYIFLISICICTLNQQYFLNGNQFKYIIYKKGLGWVGGVLSENYAHRCTQGWVGGWAIRNYSWYPSHHCWRLNWTHAHCCARGKH